MIDYRVNTFLTLYREMNYRKTAELLNMTQPGVTQHIHFLEKTYGVRLFQYDGKKLRRTRSADLLKQSLERMLAEESALRTAFRAGGEYPLRVGATRTIGEYVILPTASRFAALAENRLDLVIDNTEALLTMLENGRLDFALIEGVFDKNRFASHLYRKERFLGACRKDHPFAGRSISLERAFQESLIVREKGSGTRRILEQLLEDHSFSLENFKKTMSLNSFTAIRHFVADGLGITFAYRPIVDADPRLASFELEDAAVVREFNYVYLNRHVALEQIRRFEGRN